MMHRLFSAPVVMKNMHVFYHGMVTGFGQTGHIFGSHSVSPLLRSLTMDSEERTRGHLIIIFLKYFFSLILNKIEFI